MQELMKQETSEIVSTNEFSNQLNFFGNSNPTVAIKKATAIADAVRDIIKTKQLYTIIRTKAYVHCEGWTTMGALLGLFAHIVDVEDLSDFENMIKRYRAICEVKTLDGRTITRAESECSSEEGTRGTNKYGEPNEGKSKWDDYALRSMAETRATSKALRLALGWIMKLAGYETTSAEEIEDGRNIQDNIGYDGNGKFNKKQYDYENENRKTESDTNKTLCIRQIEWLKNKTNKKIEYKAADNFNDLCKIRDDLYKEYMQL